MQVGARPGGRLTALACVVQSDVLPSLGVATDRYLLATLGKAQRSRSGVLRVYTMPGDVLAAGRWHLAPPGTAERGESFVRRLSGGRALAHGQGYLGFSLLLPHRSAVFADDPLALAPVQVANRYVRGVLRFLKSLGLAAFYPGRDLVTVDRRPIAAVSFETDKTGRLIFEGVLAVERPLGLVAQLLDRWDPGGVIKADLLQLDDSTCLRAEIGTTPPLAALRSGLCDAFAEQFGLAMQQESLSALEEQAIAALAAREGRAWNATRAPRPELPLIGVSPIQLGVLEAHFALEQGRFIKDIMLAGDFIANSPAVAAVEQRLRLCPAERDAIGRVVDAVFNEVSNYLLGVGSPRAIAETIEKGLPR